MAHLLVVDDEADNRRTYSDVLEILGHTSDTAADAAEALRKAESGSYDLVLMDINLPPRQGEPVSMYGGLEATKRILANPRLRNLPIVAVTACGMDNEKRAILAGGCREILEKGEADFLGRIKAVIDRYTSASAPAEQPAVESAAEVVVVAREISTTRSTETSVSIERTVTATAGAPVSEWIDSDLDHSALDRVCRHIRQAIRATEEFSASAGELDRDADYLAQVSALGEALAKAHGRLREEEKPTMPDETFGHWAGNVLFGANSQCELLFYREAGDFHGQLNEQLEAIKRHFKEIFAVAKDVDRALSKCAPAPVAAASEPTARSMPPRSPLAASPPVPAAKRIVGSLLVVDNEMVVREAMESMLHSLGHDAVSCKDGQTALKLLEHQRFDACLLDLEMPGLGGLELVSRIRSIPALTNFPIIMISGNDQLDMAAEAIERGADDYLSKPVHLPLLRARIEACLKSVRSRREDLEKFLPAKVIDSVLLHPQQMRQGRPADVSVLFCDIRQFSTISDRIGASETIRWISDVMDRLSTSILDHGGTLVDYIGDEIMAMWGAPQEDAEHARQACRCALGLQQDLAALNEVWQPRIGMETRVGIGINSGTAVVGNTGSKFRFKYGPLGPTVNIASRVQGATKYLQSSILITGTTAMRLPNEERGRKLCRVRVHNVGTPIELYELAVANDLASGVRDQGYERALQAFEAEEFDQAIRLLAEILKDFPNDGPTQLLLSRVIQSQLAPGFDPIWTLPGK